MTTNLYNEAIAEAKKLKEMAEQNAKNKIIEAVTPRIRKLIEQELTDDLEDIDLDIESEPEDLGADGLIDLGSTPSMEPSPEPAEIEEETENDNKNVSINITVEGSSDRKMELDIGSLQMLKNVLNVKSKITLQEGIGKVKRVRKKAIMLKSVLEASNPSLSLNMKLNTVYNKLMSEVDSLGEYQLQDMRESRKFNKLVLETKKEMELMPRKYRRRGWLFEQEEDLGLDAEVGGGEGEEEDAPESEVEASEVEMELQGLIDAIAPESGLEVSVAGGEEGGEELDLGDEEEEDDDDDLDLEEVYAMVREMEKKDKDEMMKEADKEDKDEMMKKEGEHGDKDEMMKEEDDEGMVEISESMLRREIARLRQRRAPRRSRRISESRLRRERRRRLLREGDAVEMADQFGGGDAGDEMFVDVDEDTLLNALAEELGEVTPAEGNASAAAPSFGGGSESGEALAERRQNRLLRRKLAEAQRREQAASAELNKMNLFNAKLLYVNKLMQNRNLSAKQQRAIVEALDNAKTLNEAKLLYKSLTETLNKRKGNSLNESRARTLGSSSKSLRSGSARTTNEGHIDRWATLAGLNSKK